MLRERLVPLLWPLAAALTITYLARYLYRTVTQHLRHARLRAQHQCLPPPRAPTWDPIFGLDLLARELRALQTHTLLEAKARQFAAAGSHTLQVRFMGRTVMLTAEPANLQAVLARGFKAWSLGEERMQNMRPYLGEGIFTTDGAAWQHSRELLRPCFVRAQVGDVALFERHMRALLGRVEAEKGEDGTVDLQGCFEDFSMDVSTEFLFGESTDRLGKGAGDPETAEFVRAFAYCQNPLQEAKGKFVLLKMFLKDREFERCCKVVQAYGDTLIEKGLAKHQDTEEKRYIFLHELLSQTENKIKIRSELLNVLLAGRDTTAALLTNVWFELARRPDIQKRLRQEIQDLDTDMPSFEQLKGMKYLRALLNESLRLYPIVPENARQAVEDTTLPLGGGKDGKSPVFIAKGQYLAWSTFVMHRRKDLYGEDADEFKPERWLDEGEKKGLRVGWEFLPFNGGPRICIGQQFALMEASYATVRLLQEFSKVESRDPLPWREKISLTCTSFGGCKVALTR